IAYHDWTRVSRPSTASEAARGGRTATGLGYRGQRQHPRRHAEGVPRLESGIEASDNVRGGARGGRIGYRDWTRYRDPARRVGLVSELGRRGRHSMLVALAGCASARAGARPDEASMETHGEVD